MAGKKIKVLFVCEGNLCRSPMAEAVFRHIVEEEGLSDSFEIDSGGTSSWHSGDRPHHGTRNILREKGVVLNPDKRARQVEMQDMRIYDYVVAMDSENVEALGRFGKHVTRLLEYAPQGYPLDIPDPYYTNRFEEVYNMVEAGARGLLAHIREREKL